MNCISCDVTSRTPFAMTFSFSSILQPLNPLLKFNTPPDITLSVEVKIVAINKKSELALIKGVQKYKIIAIHSVSRLSLCRSRDPQDPVGLYICSSSWSSPRPQKGLYRNTVLYNGLWGVIEGPGVVSRMSLKGLCRSHDLGYPTWITLAYYVR